MQTTVSLTLTKIGVGLALMVAAGVYANNYVSAKKPAHANGNGSETGYLKDQCKDGGWQALGFRNQGQCVSYFASGGKAPGN